MYGGTLVMFMRSRDALDASDTEIIRSYGIRNTICVLYSYTAKMLDHLESELPEIDLDYFLADSPDDIDLIQSIKNASSGCEGMMITDVTFASPYHSAVCMNLGGSEISEIYYSRTGSEGIAHERLDRIRYDYGDLPKTYYLVLDAMTMNPQMKEQIALNMSEEKSQSTVYSALNDLWVRGLIDKVGGTVPKGYSSRTPNFFRFNPDQLWDYRSYKRLLAKRSSETGSIEQKIKVSKEMKKSSLRNRKASR